MFFFRDKDIANFIGLHPSSITNVKKKNQKMYALYRMGYENSLSCPDDKRWESVKNKDLAEHIGMTASGVSLMKRSNAKKYEILKRGFVVLND